MGETWGKGETENVAIENGGDVSMNKEIIKMLLDVLVGCISVYGAIMGFINFKIHMALKDYLMGKGLVGYDFYYDKKS